MRDFCILCALQTDRPRSDFFPLDEGPAEGYTAANLAKFGFTFGEGFISPTGAFFSPTLELVGRREPMYDPRREVEEAVFDHFAQSLMAREVTPAPDAFQMLRLKVAEAAKENPLLAKAVASTVGVAEEMDLVAAAKAKALVGDARRNRLCSERRIPGRARRDYVGHAGCHHRKVGRRSNTPAPESCALVTGHSSIVGRAINSRRAALRIELVQYYVAQGKKRLEERFFASELR